MSIFDALIETVEEEAARLAAAPPGSDDHRMAGLPVTVPGYAAGLVLELPSGGEGRIVVVPISKQVDGHVRSRGKLLHTGAFECIIVHSTFSGYPVGRMISVPLSQIRRARIIDLEGAAR